MSVIIITDLLLDVDSMSHLTDAEDISVGIVDFPNKEESVRDSGKRLGVGQYASTRAEYSIRDLHITDHRDGKC